MAKPRELRIQYMRLDKIRRDPDNPKDHDLGALAEAFKRFGFVAPMGLNEKTRTLLWGHGRLDELEQLRIEGAEPPAGIKVSPDGMWRAPVVRGVWMDEEDGQAYVVADNRLVELGGWDDPKLAQNLIKLAGSDAETGLAGTGFDGDDLDKMITMVGGQTDWFDATQLPDVPEEVAGANTKAYVVACVFVSFAEEATFERGLQALTFGERRVQREDSRYAQIDGEVYLKRWEAAVRETG